VHDKKQDGIRPLVYKPARRVSGMAAKECPPSQIVAVNVYTEPSASNGRYMTCKTMKKKETIDCTFHRWHLDGKKNVVDSSINIGEFYSVSSEEGDKCVKWPKPGKDGMSTLRNECAKGTTNAVTTCRVARLKILLPGGSAPHVLVCSSDTYPAGNVPEDIVCK
jgi:hypothetical protein